MIANKKRDDGADRRTLLAFLRVQPNRQFRAADLTHLTGVPKNRIRRLLSTCEDQIKFIPDHGIRYWIQWR